MLIDFIILLSASIVISTSLAFIIFLKQPTRSKTTLILALLGVIQIAIAIPLFGAVTTWF